MSEIDEKTHIPDVLVTKYFLSNKVSKMIKPTSEHNTVVYSFVYKCESFKKYLEYSAKAAPDLPKKNTDKFNGKVTAYRKVMEAI
ncbi:MAG: DUF4286 family protein [Bacteroidetes bacterium]|nr:DUF4286 family protein [Bacteroidota bacterium]